MVVLFFLLDGRTEPNLDDVALALKDLNIQIPDLEEYVVNVDPVPCAVHAPKFPLPKDSNLNFLKPGTKEVVTRPVHIHEHLPPIYPPDEGKHRRRARALQTVHSAYSPADVPPPVSEVNTARRSALDEEKHTAEVVSQSSIKIDDMHMIDLSDENEAINIIGDNAVVENTTVDVEEVASSEATFKKPLEAPKVPASDAAMKNGGKTTRELVSCIMTTSGFISPAREGKLPEAKRPIIILEEEPAPPVVPKRESKAHEHVDRKHGRNAASEDGNKSEAKAVHGQDVPSHAGHEGGAKDRHKLPALPKSILDMDLVALKKKLKHGPLDPATMKELKKAKKMGQLAAVGGKNRKILKMINKLLMKPTKKRIEKMNAGAAAPPALDNPPEATALSTPSRQDALHEKKKLKLEQSMKRKQMKMLQRHDGLADMSPKPRKKTKLAKHGGLDAMGPPAHDPNTFADRFGTPSQPDMLFHPMKPTPEPGDPKLRGDYYDQQLSAGKMAEASFSDKLSNEPDKRKLNIFKKISSSGSSQAASQFDQPAKKLKAGAVHCPSSDPGQPMPMAPDLKQMPYFNELGVPTASLAPAMDKNAKKKIKAPKIPKERKLKKDGSPRKQRQPKELKEPPMPPDMQSNPKLPMQMFPNMGMFDQYAGPGLIPSNPLIPSTSFGIPGPHMMGNNPFNVMNKFDLMNLRFKRPNFSEMPPGEPHTNAADDRFDPGHKEPAASAMVKPSCHVAPLVPPSLLNPDKPSTSTSHADSTQGGRDQFHSQKRAHLEQHFERVSHTTSSAGGLVADSSIRTTYDSQLDQKTTIVLDSDDEEELIFKAFKPSDSASSNDPPPSAAPAAVNQSPEQLHDPKREKKKLKDKGLGGHQKKEKRDKEGNVVKLKKKKKDKNKNKEHPDAYTDKAALKEEKRRKKKEKDRLALEASSDRMSGEFGKHDVAKESLRPSDSFESREFTDASNSELSTIPKLTLKLAPSSSSPSPRPATPDIHAQKKR